MPAHSRAATLRKIFYDEFDGRATSRQIARRYLERYADELDIDTLIMAYLRGEVGSALRAQRDPNGIPLVGRSYSELSGEDYIYIDRSEWQLDDYQYNVSRLLNLSQIAYAQALLLMEEAYQRFGQRLEITP